MFRVKTLPVFSVWLTNALEEGEREVRDLFFAPLANEARGANDVKRQTPIMCIIGNPPYAGESANKGNYIMSLVEAYKKEPGGKEKLKERNPKWINDDYVKFIRMSENLIAQNGEGVLGFITNHGYLDNPTFRGMRWHLLKTFDKIYVLDLHGNTKKKEVSPDGSPDINVFDIQQGVALLIGIKNSTITKQENLAQVKHGQLFGKRKGKSEALWSSSMKDIIADQVTPQGPHYLFVPRDHELEANYQRGFAVPDLLKTGVMGFQTHRDHFAIAWYRSEILTRCKDLLDRSQTDQEIFDRYEIKDNRDWKLSNARKLIRNNSNWQASLTECQYRPFDTRPCYLSYVMMDYPRTELIQHGLNKNNIFLGVGRQGLAVGGIQWCLATVSTSAMDANIYRRGGVNSMPLYLYPDEETEQGDVFASTGRTVNFDAKIYTAICKTAGLDKDSSSVKADAQNVGSTGPGPSVGNDVGDFRILTGDDRPTEVKVFDYIYGVLHSPDYRETYKEFLKIEFPRIPYPASPEVFKHVSEKGEALRRLHLMEASAIGDTPYVFHGDGDDVVASGYPKWEPISPSSSEEGEGVVAMPKVSLAQRSAPSADGPHPNPSPEGEGLETGRVYINPEQYFDAVPRLAWDFYIGGYQPAQKWLKDRRGRALSYDDIGHYQKIIKILTETDRIMKEIKLPLD